MPHRSHQTKQNTAGDERTPAIGHKRQGNANNWNYPDIHPDIDKKLDTEQG